MHPILLKKKKKGRNEWQRIESGFVSARILFFAFSPFPTVVSIRKTDARWKKQWGHDERRTLTGCGYCFGGGDPVIGHFRRYRNPHGAKVDKEKEKKKRKKISMRHIRHIYMYIT